LLARFRRHALAVSFVVAAFISPGDAITTSIGLWLPLYLLYEISIGVSWLVFRKREQAKEDELEDRGVPA
jgi:Sec-independent protein secretion pathway component TatC